MGRRGAGGVRMGGEIQLGTTGSLGVGGDIFNPRSLLAGACTA